MRPPRQRHRSIFRPRLSPNNKPRPRRRHWHSSFSHSFHRLLQDQYLDKDQDPDQNKALDQDQE